MMTSGIHDLDGLRSHFRTKFVHQLNEANANIKIEDDNLVLN